MPDSSLGNTKCGPRDGRGDPGGQGCPLALSLCATTFLFPFLPSHFPLALGTGPVQVACPGCWHVGSRSLAQHGTARHTESQALSPPLPPHGGHGEDGAARKLQPHCWGRTLGGDPNKDMLGQGRGPAVSRGPR